MRILLLGLLCLLCSAQAQAANPIAIGVVYNLSGSMASIDTPGLQGMKLAVERINREGGVLGRPLHLEVRDGQSDVARCREAVLELVKLKVAAIAGLNDSDFALAAGQAAAQARVPFVTAGATLPDLPVRLGGYFFMACFGDDAQAKAMSTFALRQGKPPMLVLTNRKSAFATALADYFAVAYGKEGGKIEVRSDFDEASPAPLGQDAVDCLRAETCRAVFAAGQPEDAVPMVKALRNAGYAGPVYSGDGFDTPLLGQLGDMAAPGVFFSTHASFSNPRPQVQAFVGAWEAAYGGRPTSAFAALGYDAVGLVASALTRAASTDPARVKKGLAAISNYEGVSGEISFAEPQSPPRKQVIIERFAGGRKSFETVILP